MTPPHISLPLVKGNRSVFKACCHRGDGYDPWCPPLGLLRWASPTTEAGRNADREDELYICLSPTVVFHLSKYESLTQAQTGL